MELKYLVKGALPVEIIARTIIGLAITSLIIFLILRFAGVIKFPGETKSMKIYELDSLKTSQLIALTKLCYDNFYLIEENVGCYFIKTSNGFSIDFDILENYFGNKVKIKIKNFDNSKRNLIIKLESWDSISLEFS